jgi:hypothetical protein
MLHCISVSLRSYNKGCLLHWISDGGRKSEYVRIHPNGSETIPNDHSDFPAFEPVRGVDQILVTNSLPAIYATQPCYVVIGLRLISVLCYRT